MPSFFNKICSRPELSERIASLPRPLVVTNGVFDILHLGHVTYLARAKALGASLIVAVNTDASVRRLGKGEDRPINSCEDRLAVLAALESVDLVVSFDEDTALEVVREIIPELYVKGGDYDVSTIPEGVATIAQGGRVLAIPFEYERSTTETISKIKQHQ